VYRQRLHALRHVPVARRADVARTVLARIGRTEQRADRADDLGVVDVGGERPRAADAFEADVRELLRGGRHRAQDQDRSRRPIAVSHDSLPTDAPWRPEAEPPAALSTRIG